MKGINTYAMDYPVCLAGRSEPNLKSSNLNMKTRISILSEQAKRMVSTIHGVNLENEFGNDPRFLPSKEQYDPCKERHFKEFLDTQPNKLHSENSWTVKREDLDKDNYDLAVQNPNKVEEVDNRTPQEIIAEIEQLDAKASEASLMWTKLSLLF